MKTTLIARSTSWLGHALPLLLLLLCPGCSNARTSARGQAPVTVTPPPPPVAGKAPCRFTDVTEQAGIHFMQQSSKTARKYLVETFGSGCAFIDYDGDGWQDILLLNNTLIPGGHVIGKPAMALYHNERGKFTDVTHQAGLDIPGLYATGVAVGDYDNDGHEDFYVSCVLGPSHLFHNEGNGKFRDVTLPSGVSNKGKWGTSCAWVDYDNDGKLDLFVCNYVKYASVADDQPCFSGENKRVYCIPSAYETSACTLYHNEGNGRFRDVSVESGIAASRGKSLGVTIWDYDNDGKPDIFVANDTVPGFVFHNEGHGRFTDVGAVTSIAYDNEGNAHSGMGIDADDVNNDGKTVVAITNYQGQQTSFYTQTSKDVFEDTRVQAGIGHGTRDVLGFGVAFADYDNDGFKDMLQVNGHVQDDIQQREPLTEYKQPTLLFHNQRNGVFDEVGLASGAPFSRRSIGRACAWGDFDNDGRLDILVLSCDGPAELWRNETPTNNHFLTLKLIGKRSNRDGIGAMVIVKAGGLTMRTRVRSGSSYLSQSDLRAHFGLGMAGTADVEIHWPSGVVDKLKQVAGDQIRTVREGSAKVE